MTITNAIKKVEKLSGQEVQKDEFGCYAVNHKGYILSFYKNGREENITCIHTCKAGQKSDSMTDYFPGTYHDNITKAFSFIERK